MKDEARRVRIMHIDCSRRFAGSASRKLSARFVERLAVSGLAFDVDRLDLAVSPPQHFGEVQTAAMYLAEAERSPDMVGALADSDALCERVLAADGIVCGIPMYNFGMPSAFKAFVDHVVRSGKTFEVTGEGVVGHLAGTRAVFIMTTGGDYRSGATFEGMDCLTPHLETVCAFVGIPNPDIVHAQPMQFEGEDAKEQALHLADRLIADLAGAWARDLRGRDEGVLH